MTSRVSVADRAFALRDKAKEILGGDDGAVMSKARSVLSGDGQYFSAAPKMDQIREQLADPSISVKKEGMKRIIAGICKGTDMSPLFADVVKNIHVESIELRKLVYYYVVHYAEERPNESLLSISAFQKDLVNSSMHVRSLALRMLSSIRIPAIHPVVMVAIKKSSTDMSTVVRKTAAISLSQAHSVSGGEESYEALVALIGHFFGDRSTEVLGAAALSYMEICPNQVQLIHKHFRRICRSLVDCDEWGQVVLLHVLLRYARTQFIDPNAEEKPKPKVEEVVAEDGDITTPETSDTESDEDEAVIGGALKLHPDHRLLIQSVRPLLLSLNRAVVLGAVSLLFHVAPHSELDQCVRPLLRLLSGRAEGHTMVLSAIHTIMLTRPNLFAQHIREFFLNSDDSNAARELKIRIIAALASESTFSAVSAEFRSYLRSFDIRKVVSTVRGLGLISHNLPGHANQILQLITPLLSHRSAEVVTEAVVVLRQLVVQGSERSTTCRIIHRLLVQLMKGEIKAPTARASIIWLVGENINSHVAIAKSAPDCFRLFAKTFATEEASVKKQVLTLGTKLWFHLDGEGEVAERFKQIFFHVLELVKYDADYELRDRGRMIETAVDRQSASFATLKAAMLAQKPAPRQRDPFAEKAKFQVGSLSHLCGTALLGYQELPQWPEEMPDPYVRDPAGEKKAAEKKQLACSSSSASSYDSSDSDGSSSASSSSSSDSSDSDEDSDSSDSDSDASSQSSSSSSSASSSGSIASSPSSSGSAASSTSPSAPAAAAPRKIITTVLRGAPKAAAKPTTSSSSPARTSTSAGVADAAPSPTVHEMTITATPDPEEEKAEADHTETTAAKDADGEEHNADANDAEKEHDDADASKIHGGEDEDSDKEVDEKEGREEL